MRHIVLLMLLLTGCSATGPAFDRSMVRDNLVIYRPDGFYSGIFQIEVNGRPVCKLKKAGYVVVKDSNRELNITSEIWDMPGVSRLTVINKGDTYVRADVDADKQAAGVVGGYIGEAMHGMTGPYIFTEVPESQALRELEGLKRDCE